MVMTAFMNLRLSWLFTGITLAALASSAHAEGCANLVAPTSARAQLLLAQTVATGSFTPPDSPRPLQELPTFCRAVLSLHPSSDSEIGAEIWLPENWNNKLLMVGSGGWGGGIDYQGLAAGLRRGYAVGATDDGHRSSGAGFILGHPQKFIDFAYRAQHETTLAAKALVKARYARIPSHSYWQGCSGGGREGLIQAYRYPDEFDGIIAGDPADIRRNAWALWLAVQALSDPAAYIPPSKYPMIHAAVLAACDANDGLKDGLISDPRNCHVDFSSLQCKGPDAPQCLTTRQVQTARTMISPATGKTGKVLFPQLEPGTELRWGRMAAGPGPAELFLDEFRYVVYQDANWDWHTFDLDRDAADRKSVV